MTRPLLPASLALRLLLGTSLLVLTTILPPAAHAQLTCPDCTPLDDQCNVGVCNTTTGLCEAQPANEGLGCDDGNACTQTDTCQAGICTGANPVVCTASDQCHDVGTCDTGTGVCSNPAKADNTTCDDGDACTQTDTCQVGVCTGANPVVCTASDQCHDIGTCDTGTGVCSNPAKADNTTCSDGNACTQTDTCQAGVCTGASPVVCTASDQCHDVGTCNTGTGVCSNPVKPNNSVCNDGNACTQTDTCQAGICTGTGTAVCVASDQCHDAGVCDIVTGTCSNPVKADNTACSDGNACTQTDTCQAGVCTGASPVVCTASDQCHDVGVCNTGTGVCSNPAKANNSTCNDANACTQTDTCQAGICTGTNPVVCTASDQCHDVGTCDTTSGVCSNPTKPDNSTCNDGNGCTQTDTCQLGVCTGANPVVCTAADQCHDVGTCNTGTGICSNPAKADNTACNDGNACTQTDTCQLGVCTGATSVVCTAADQCHDVGICNTTSGVCSNPAKADNTACSDGNACTQTDTCQLGICTGANPVACAASDQCHNVGTCDTTSGVCSNPAKADNTACNDGNACTQTDTCQVGVCTGVGSLTCVASDQCHDVGICDITTGTCTNPAKADGSVCSDGLFCTVGEICTAGVCGGSIPRDCSAANTQCALGACNESAGACQPQPANSGATCDDANPCTTADVCSTAGVCTGTPIVACGAPRLVVANSGDNTANVVRTNDLAVEGTPVTGVVPKAVVVGNDGGTAYVVNGASDSVSVINLVTSTTTGSIPVGTSPAGIAITPDGSQLYVTNSAADSVSVIDTASGGTINTILLDPTNTLLPFGPTGVAVTPNGAFVYVANSLKNTVSVIRTIDGLLIAETPVGHRPGGVAANPNGLFVYVANQDDNSISVVRTLDNAQYAVIPVGRQPFGLACTPDGAFLFVSNAISNTIYKINTANFAITGSRVVDPVPGGIAILEGGTRAFVTSATANTVTAIDVASNNIVGKTAVGKAPVAVAVTPSTILKITGSAAPNVVAPGGTLVFNFVYGNAGHKAGQGVTINATLPATATFASATNGGVLNGTNVTWTIGALPPGITGQVSFTVTVRSPLAPGTIVKSTATIADSSSVTGQGSASAQVQSNPQYSLAVVDDLDPVAAGGLLTYTISYANNALANADGEGVSIAETYDPNVTFVSSVPPPIAGTNNQWALGSVPVGASGNVVVTVRVKSPLSNGTILDNTATLRDTFNTTVSATQNTVVTSNPLLGIAIADDHDPAAAGGLVNYTINYTNTGNANATGVQITSQYDPNVIFVSAAPAPDAGTNNRWTVGNFNVGDSGVIVVTARIAGVMPDGAILTNQATVTAANSPSATAATNTTVSSAAALMVTMADDPDPIVTGETITYTLSYANAGTDLAPGSTLTLAYDSGITFVSAVPPPTTGTNQWDLGTLTVGAGGTVVITATVDAPLGSILNTAATLADSLGHSATSTSNTTVQITPVISLSMSNSADPVPAGGLLTYTLRYGNTGNTAATNLKVAAVYDSRLTFVSSTPTPDAGTSNAWTIGTVNKGVNGQIAVTVRVNSPLANGTILSTQGVLTADGGLVANGSQTTTVQSAPAIALSMTDGADPTPPAHTLTYNISYANSGNDSTSGVVVTESYDPAVTFVSAVPAPDAGTNNTWTIGTLAGGQNGSILVTVNVPAMPNGSALTNRVTMQDAASHSAVATENTTVASSVFSLSTTDSIDPATAGQAVTYTLNFANASTGTQTGAVVHASLDSSFNVESTVPPADAGTSDTWSLGALAAGQTGQITITGFFANPTVNGTLAHTQVQISNANGAAFDAETTTINKSPAVDRRIMLRKMTHTDRWELIARFPTPTGGFDPTGLPVEVFVFGPGGVKHINPFVAPPLTQVGPIRWRFSGDVPDNGKAIASIVTLPGNIRLSVVAHGPDIVPPFSPEDHFQVLVRIGNRALMSASGKLRMMKVPVRRYP